MGYDLSFLTKDIWRAQDLHWQRIRQLFAGEQPDWVPLIWRHGKPVPIHRDYDPAVWLDEAIEEFRAEADLFADVCVWVPFALTLQRYQLHFLAALFGCRIWERDEIVWRKSLSAQGRRMEDLRAPDLASNAVYREMIDLIRFVLDATGGAVPIELPELLSPLTEAVTLFEEEFLIALRCEPELAQHVLGVIARTTTEVHSGLLAEADGAFVYGSLHECTLPGYNTVLGCSSQLVSPHCYAQYAAGWDEALLLNESGGGSMHLCGTHTQHMDCWREMRGLKAVQLNDRASDDLEAYWKGLRSDQIIVLWPTETMTIDDAVRITGGRRLVIGVDGLDEHARQPIPVR